MNVSVILLVISMFLFGAQVVCTLFEISTGKLNLIAAGLFCFAASFYPGW
jgi:hypothetical protein